MTTSRFRPLFVALLLAGSSTLAGAQRLTRAFGRPPAPAVLATGMAGNAVKTFTDINGGSVLPGDTLVVDISVTNVGGPDDAIGTVINDVLPATVTYVPGTMAVTSGPNTGPKTDAAGDDQGQFFPAVNRVRLRIGVGASSSAGGTLGTNASTAIRFRVVVNNVVTGTVISNVGTVNFRDAGTGLEVAIQTRPPGGPVGPTSVTVQIPDLTIAKTHSGNFTRGTSASYSLAVSNIGAGQSAGTISVSDVVPAGLTPTAASGAGWSCSIVAQTVTCTSTTPIAAGASAAPITLTVDVLLSATNPTINTATVSGGGETNAGNNSASDPTTVVGSTVDVAIAKTHVGNFVGLRQGTWTLAVTNTTSSSATGPITITDTLPTGITFVSGTGTSWSCTAVGQVVTCSNPGPLGAGASTSVAMLVDVGALAWPGVTNRAWVDIPGDVVPGNNSSTDPTTVESIPDMTITKVAGGVFTVGSNATYTLGVTNISSGPTYGAITVTDTLPSGLSFVSGTGTGWTCGSVAQVVTCTNPGPIASGGSSSITLTVAVAAAAAPSVTNRAHVTSPGDVNRTNNSSTVTTPVGGPTQADLTVTKTHVGNFIVGTNAAWTIRVTNSGTAAFSGTFTLVDTLPAGITYVSGPAPCGAVGQVVTCNVTTPIAIGGSTQAVFTVAVGGAAVPSVVNRVHVASAGDGNPANNTATDTATVLSIPDLSIVKVANGTFSVGGSASYTLTVTNVSTGSTTGAITVTDALPAGLIFVSGTGTGWTCSAAGQNVTCTNPGPLAPSAASAITLAVSVGAPASPSVGNTANVSTPGDFNTGNNASTVVTPVTSPDLSITKTASAGFVVGSNGTYTLVIANGGTAASGAITVTDTLPGGLSFVSGTGPGWTCGATGQVVTCTNPGPIAVSGSSSITLTVGVTGAAAPSVTNRAHVTTPNDPNPANDSDSEVTPVTVPGTPNLAITKGHSGNFIAGQNGTWTITVTNVGAVATTGAITVTDTLPTGITFVSGTGTSWTCSASGQVVTCTNPGPLAVSASSALTLTAAVGGGALPGVTNRAHVSTPGDADPSNDSASDPTNVVSIPDLAIVKVANGAFAVGSNASYILTISNVSAGSTTGAVTVSDMLPAGLTFVSGTGTGWTCNAVAQAVTCTNPGPIAASASSAITLTVAVGLAAAPSVTNTATVSTPGDFNGSNDASTVVTPVPSPALDLAIAKTTTSGFVAGQNGTYLLTVSNVSLAPTTGATTIGDVLPAGLTFISGAGTGFTCSAAGQSVTCIHAGSIAAGQVVTASVTVAVSPTLTGSISNTATVSTPGDANNGNNSSTLVHPVASGVDLAIAKSSSALAVGSNGTFTITVSNVGSASTTGPTTITDNLPAGITYLNASGGGFTCTVAGALVTCTRSAVLAPGQSASVQLAVAVSTLAFPAITNTATVSTPGDTNPTNNTASTGVVLVTAPAPDLTLAKAIVSAFVPGTNGTFRLTISNIGTGAATGPITVTDLLQAGLTFVSGAGAGWTCSATGQLVTCVNAGPMAPGATSTIDLVVSIAPSVTSVSNTGTVSAPGDTNGGNNSGSIPVTPVSLPPDLTLTKAASGPFTVGQPASYTITVRNTGLGPTVGLITVTDLVPSTLTVTGATGPGWTCTITGQSVSCTNPGPLAPNASSVVTIGVIPTGGAVPSVTNVATVTTPGDADGGNNGGTVTTPVSGVVDLALEKQGPDSITVGGNATYTLLVRNTGNITTSAPIVVTDSLPAGLTFVGATGPGFTCSAAGQVVTCTRTAPPLAPGATVSIELTASISSAVTASVRNAACVRTTGDANTANDCSSKTSTPSGSVDLVAFKDLAGPVTVGQPATFTLAVRNFGSAPAQGPITVVDTLPAGLTFVSATGSGWQCGASGNVVTCIRPTALAPNQVASITLTVNVAAAAAPQVTNCMNVRGVNENASLNNNRSCVTPVVEGAGRLEIEKRTSRTEVMVGDVVDYVVVVKNSGLSAVNDAVLTDVLPAGFLLEAQSVRVNGVGGATVTGAPGPQFTVDLGRIPVAGEVVVTYRVRVGPGARPGPGVNVATAASRGGGGASPPARASVKVTGGVFDERGAIVGKVYIQCDCERGGLQDAGEVGIPGVRVYLEDGTSAITDVEGKYNFYNVASRLHVVKVDRASLPEGAVMVPLVNRNAMDGYTRFADVKAGELHRADFADGSRDREVLGRVLERRRQGEVTNAGERAVPTWHPGEQPVGAPAPRDTLRGEARAAHDLRASDGTPGAAMYAAPPIFPKGTSGSQSSEAYGPLMGGGRTMDDANSQLPITPLRARAAQSGTSRPAGRVEIGLQPIGLPADGQTLVPVSIQVLDAAGNPVRGDVVATLEASVGRWLNTSAVETESGGYSVTLANGAGKVYLVAPPAAARGEVRVTTSHGEATIPVTFVPSVRALLVTGLVNARVDFLKLVQGSLGVGATSDGFEEALRDWSFSDDSATTRGGARAAVLVKGTVLDNRLLTLSYDSERDRGRTFFRDIRPEEFFPVYGDASAREFDAQSRRRFYARMDKGTSYAMYGDFQTTRADDRRMLSSYDRSLTGGVQHVEGRRGSGTFFASQGRISQSVDEIPGRGISGPYALSRATGLVNSERVEVIVRDRNQPTVILSRSSMTRFADYTIEPVSGRILFRAPVPSADANLNPVSIRVTYETEDGRSEAFWVYGFDGSVRAGSRLELGGTFARDEGPNSSHRLVGLNATAKLGAGTLLFGEFAQTENAAGTTGDAQRVELRHQSSGLDARLFGIRSDAGFANQSSIFAGGRTEMGGRFSRQLGEGTRLVGEALRSEFSGTDTRRQGALLSLEKQLTPVLRGEIGYRYAKDDTPDTGLGATPGAGAVDRDVSALRGRLQWALPQQTRTSLFGEVEQDIRDGDQRRLALGGEHVIANRARLYGRHEFLSGFVDPYAPTNGAQDKQYTVFGIDADYLKNTQVFSEYRARDAFGGRDAQASIGLRNRWAVAPGLVLNTSFERVSPLFRTDVASAQQNEALAVTGAVEWTRPSLWKSTARLEFRNAETGDNTLASFGYARKLSRDWTLLGRTLWDDFDATQRQTRGFSQLGLAWRETDRNHWNAVARYEQRFERSGALGANPATRSLAHIVAAMLNYQPVQRFTLSGRYAARTTNDRSNGLETNSTAQLLMGRGVLDLTSRLDAGLIASTLFSDGFSDRKYGLGGELGLLVMKNLRVAGGYNVFGFTDRDLNSFGTTRKGPYLELGFKFDEGLFGIGGDRATSRAVRDGGNK